VNRYFDKINNRLVYVGEAASDTFWDNHWKSDDPDFEKRVRAGRDSFVIGNTKRYLPLGARILEGGCGLADKVYALHRCGYDAYGVDYARQVVEKVNHCVPELKVQFGDVRQLPFPESFFDGYWSLGVIEHYYDGYDRILQEMHRVLNEGGYLFVTVPVMSWLRRKKAKLGKYPKYKDSEKARENFYQFAFEHQQVINVLKHAGFKLIDVKPYDGIKGLKDEISILKPLLQPLYDARGLPAAFLKRMLDFMLKRFANHMSLFIMRKVEVS
jgi:SAM-dependent methyltransferase